MSKLTDILRRLRLVEQEMTGAGDELQGRIADQGEMAQAHREWREAVDEQVLVRLMQLLEQTREGEYSCRETLDLLDEYIDLGIANCAAAEIMPLLAQHLAHCVECQERYQVLLKILTRT
jgi:hypothetical protein